jgi:hypothetical protein
MTSPHIKMDVAFPRMIAGIQVGKSCKEWTRISGIRMEVNVIDEVAGQVKNKAKSGYDQRKLHIS